MQRYVILDDVYMDKSIELFVGREIIDFDKSNNEIVITIEQLTELLKNIIKHERSK